jgi:hypothetical protein
MGAWGSFPGIKRPESEAGYSPPSIAGIVENENEPRGFQKVRMRHEGRKRVKDLGGGRRRYLRKRPEEAMTRKHGKT